VPSLAILLSAVLVLSFGQNHRITDRIIEADDRCTRATTVGVNNNNESTKQLSVHAHYYKRAHRKTELVNTLKNSSNHFKISITKSMYNFDILYYRFIHNRDS